MAQAGFREIVEAAYRLSVSRPTWLDGLARASDDAFGQGRGTVAIVVDATDIRRPRALDYRSTRAIPSLDRVVEDALARLQPEYVEESLHPSASLATEADGMAQPGIRLWLEAFGARDLLTILAMDASGLGVLVAVNLAAPANAQARRSISLAQLAAHVLGAYRLREQVPSEEEAVFRASGDVVSANGAVRDSGALGDLTSAVRALGALRASDADDARALGEFTSRVDATWSVVAEVADGAEQWVVARRNPPTTIPLPESLSLRERQVMSLLLLGRTPKVVAYELGIAHSTVRVLVSRALAKVGAKSVDELRARGRSTHAGSSY